MGFEWDNDHARVMFSRDRQFSRPLACPLCQSTPKWILEVDSLEEERKMFSMSEGLLI